MKAAVVLIHNNRLYRKIFDVGEEISFGSFKKDDVVVPDFMSSTAPKRAPI